MAAPAPPIGPPEAALAALHNNRGAALLADRRIAEALTAFEAALALVPALAEAHANRGAALAALGRLEAAVDSYGTAIALKPAMASAHANQAAVLARLGRLDEAIEARRRVTGITPRDAAAHLALAALLTAAGRPDAAIAACETALSLGPTAQAHNEHGAALAMLERFEAAADAFQRAIALSPGFVDAWCNLAGALAAQARQDKSPQDEAQQDEAVRIYEHLLAAAPNHVAALAGLADALEALGRSDEALARARQALAIAPMSAPAHHTAGQALVSLGRLDEAATAFCQAIALSPRTPQFYWALGECTGFAGDAALLPAMQALAGDASLPEPARMRLDFALFRALDQAGRREEAFRSLAAAAAAGRRRTPYDEAATLERFHHLEALFPPERLRRPADSADPSALPVFIVGMPRSGGTLVEQILASHPQVAAGGELTLLPELAGKTPAALQGEDPDAPAALEALGRRYLQGLRAMAPDAQRITDKLPANFALVGLIRLALPGATVIHVRRDPVDTCVSCFSKLFAGGQPFAKDLGELGRYYRAYAGLMAHWRPALPPGAWVEVDYEALVGDLEGQARRLVSACGLDWSPACLDFHRTARPVRTASAAQVRRPIYRDAIGRGRAYGPWLTPLYDALGPELVRAP